MKSCAFPIADKVIYHVEEIQRSFKFDQRNVPTKEYGKTGPPYCREVPPVLESVLQYKYAPSLFSKSFYIVLSVDDQQTGQNLGCRRNHFSVTAYKEV